MQGRVVPISKLLGQNREESRPPTYRLGGQESVGEYERDETWEGISTYA